jgi:hypothetical protein
VKIGLIKILLAAALVSDGFFFQQIFAEEKGIFRAAVVKIDITPDNPQWLGGYNERKSTGVHDHIYHRIVALDDGASQFFLVSTESVSMSPAQYDHVAARLEKQFGIKPVNFWWALTHTHSAPRISKPGIFSVFNSDVAKQYDSVYAASVEQKIIEGVAEAKRNLTPARLGVGWGFSSANINRRAVDMEGVAQLGMNPDGAVDRRIGLIRIDKADGSPLALIANYPIHGTVLGCLQTRRHED